MRFCRMIAVTTLMMVGLSGQSALANNKRAIPIVGLWEGIDLDDGASHLRSIRRNEDGTFSLVGNSTYYTLCDGSDRGLIIGTGVFENGVLKAKSSLTCFNNGRTVKDLESNYVLNMENGTLTEQRTWGVKQPIIFHLTSPRPKE